MEESRENCIDRSQEPNAETVELLGLIQKYPVVILTLLVSPHIQSAPTVTIKRRTLKPFSWTQIYMFHMIYEN